MGRSTTRRPCPLVEVAPTNFDPSGDQSRFHTALLQPLPPWPTGFQEPRGRVEPDEQACLVGGERECLDDGGRPRRADLFPLPVEDRHL